MTGSEIGLVLGRLREAVAHGWWKLNDDGSKTFAGSPPYLDLYWGIRLLDQRFPVHRDVSVIFDRLARAISNLYPERVRTQIVTTYDARIAVMEFNDNPRTTLQDVLWVLSAAGDT